MDEERVESPGAQARTTPRAERAQLPDEATGVQQQMLEQVRDAIVVHALDGTVSYWNRGAERMFGLPRAEAVGRSFAQLLSRRAVLPRDAHAMLLQEGNWSGELDCVAPNGRILTVELHCSLVRDDRQRVSAVLCTMTDLTERQRADKEIVLLNNVLEQRIRKRTFELEESNEDLRDFAYSLAHDLRAPLASIDGFSAQLEIRLQGTLDDKSRHYLARVRAGVKLMADLTDALLALADLSNAQLLHQNVNLSAVASGILERLQENEPQRDVSFEVAETRNGQGDVRLITDVLENLLGNAWKFTSRRAGARIEFGGTPWLEGTYRYHVRDNGAGFDPAYAYKLFGPFQRLHTTSEFEGTGIGLAMVRKIVSRHGGRVWAESAPGEGAVFFFTLNEAVAPMRTREDSAPLA